MATLPVNKDPQRLRGTDAAAHEHFRALEPALGRASTVDETIRIVVADPAWPTQFRREAERIRTVLSVNLAPEIEHIGSTSVPYLDGKPIIDIMVGISDPAMITEVIHPLEKLHYESLGEAGVPGRWALRRRISVPHCNISIIAHNGTRWWQNLAVRNYLRNNREVAHAYGAAKWKTIERGATTLIAYSDEKRKMFEAIATAAERDFPTSVSHVEPKI